MLGGRGAEEVVYGSRTTGAQNDIEQATGLARQMVTRWGMSDKLGMLQLAPRQETGSDLLRSAPGLQRRDGKAHRLRGGAHHQGVPGQTPARSKPSQPRRAGCSTDAT